MVSFKRLPVPNFANLISYASGGIGSLLALTPALLVWDYGGALPWTLWFASISVTVIGLLAIPFLLIFGRSYRPLQLAIPMLSLMAVGFGWSQSWAVPSSINQYLSPGVHDAYENWVPDSIRQEWASSSGTSDNEVLDPVTDFETEHHPTSLCRTSTTRWLVVPALIGSITLISIFTLRDQKTLFLVLMITAISGTLVALLGLLDTVRLGTPGLQENLFMPDTAGGGSFGPFVNRNNAGGFLNLTLAATLALFVWSIRKSGNRITVDAQYAIPPANAWDRISNPFMSVVGRLDGPAVTSLIAVLIQVVAIAASQSRGALIAAIAGGMIATTQLVRRNKTINPGLVIGVVVALVIARWMLVYLGLDQVVDARVESIFNLGEGSQVDRLELIADSMRAAIHYFPAGSGAGTFEYALLPYQQATANRQSIVHADCMPAEWMVEGGVWMIGILIAGIALIMKSLSIMAVHRRSHYAGLTAMGWYLLVSQSVACCFDFGILLPANFMTAAVLIGVFFAMLPMSNESQMVRRSRERRSQKRNANLEETAQQTKPAQPWSRLIGPVSIAVLACMSMVMACRISKEYAQCSFESFELSQRIKLLDQMTRTRETVDHLPAYATRISNDPQRDFIASVALLVQQQHVSPLTNDPIEWDSDDLQNPDPSKLRKLEEDPRINVRRMVSVQQKETTAQVLSLSEDSIVLLDGQDLATIRQARRQAVAAIVRCPLHPFVRITLIRTDFVRQLPTDTIAAKESNADLTFRLATEQFRLQLGHLAILDQVTRLCFVYPGPDTIDPFVKRLLELSPSRFESLWPMIRQETNIERIGNMIPDDLEAIVTVAESQQVPQELRQKMLEKANAILLNFHDPNRDVQLTEAELAHLSGRISLASQKDVDAIQSFEHAVRLAPSNPKYRVDLINVLIQIKEYDLAIEHLERAIIQQPNNQGLRLRQKRVRDLMQTRS